MIEPRWPDERELAASSLPSFGGLSQSGCCWAAAGLHVPSPSTEWAVCGGRCRRSLSPIYTVPPVPLSATSPQQAGLDCVCVPLSRRMCRSVSLSLFFLCVSAVRSQTDRQFGVCVNNLQSQNLLISSYFC